MTPEQLKIYNKARIKKGLPPIKDDSVTTFSKETDEVMPYITGLQTTVDDPDYAKNMKQELDWISNSTHYLFDAVDAGKEAYEAAQGAAADAKDAYDSASQAQQDANAAMQEAIDANTKAIEVAEDLVTVQGDIDDINTTVGDLSDSVTGLETTVGTQQGQITEALEVAHGAEDEYTAQWGVKTDVNGVQGGVGFANVNGKTMFVIQADVFAVFDGDTAVMEENGGVLRCYAPVDFSHTKGLFTSFFINGSGTKHVAAYPHSMWVCYNPSQIYTSGSPTLVINGQDQSGNIKEGLPWSVQIAANTPITITYSGLTRPCLINIVKTAKVH